MSDIEALFLSAVEKEDLNTIETLIRGNDIACIDVAKNMAYQKKKGSYILNLFIKYGYATCNEAFAKASFLRKNAIARFYLNRRELDLNQACKDSFKHGNVDLLHKVIIKAIDKNIDLSQYMVDIVINDQWHLADILAEQDDKYAIGLVKLCIKYNKLQLAKNLYKDKHTAYNERLYGEYIDTAFKYHRKNFIEWFMSLDDLFFMPFYIDAAYKYGNVETFSLVVEKAKTADGIDPLYVKEFVLGDPQNEFSDDPLVVREYFRIKNMRDLLLKNV